MLSEFAIAPEVFRIDEYGDNDVLARMCLGNLYTALLDDCVVRNLNESSWACHVLKQKNLHEKGREIIRKLDEQSRLIESASILPPPLYADEDWEQEALLSHKQLPLAGLIFGSKAKEKRHKGNPSVSCPQRILTAPFWMSRTCSKRIARSVAEYRKLVIPILHHANWIAFVDPHFDPSTARYDKFKDLLEPCMGRDPAPKIEIHRVAWLGDGRDKTPKCADIKQKFVDCLTPELESLDLEVEVFLWDDFHDRFLISNLIGLSWSNGFDTTAAPAASVTVSRLSRSDRDEVQKEFSPSSPMHGLKHRFSIG